jgi:hypothetical protein
MGAKTTTTYTSSVIPPFYQNYAQDIITNQQNVSSRPFVPYDPASRVAGFNATQNQGFDLTKAAAGSYQPVLGAALEGVNNVAGRSSLNAASPFIAGALDTSGLKPAYGALENAARSSVSDVNDYMNPYLNNVINRYGEIGARTLNEKLIPAVTSKYISAGQIGGPTRAGTGATGAPSGMMTDTARALRDIQDSVGQQQLQALSQGYESAVGASAADKSRQATVGSTYANIAQNNQQLMATLAGQIASIYGQDTANALAASGQLATIANQMQTQGLAGAKAITDIGTQEQLLEQKNKDVSYEEVMRKAGFDQAQIDAATRTLQGVGAAIPQGSVSVQQNKAPNSSLLGTVGGGALALAGAGGRGAV